MIETAHLLLRAWRPSDYEPFAAINADPRVCEFLPSCLTSEESDAFALRIEQGFARDGFGLYAVEEKQGESFVGYVGLNIPSFEAHFTPCVEIGWRLSSDHWGKGYATEAAKAVLDYSLNTLGLPEVVSFTVPLNHRSRRVMEKIGMRHDKEGDFLHPRLPKEHALARHVLYRSNSR